MTDMVRVYMFTDSGPYAEWSLCPDDWKDVARNGFGRTPIREVPAELWQAFVDARDARDEAETALDDYVTAVRWEGAVSMGACEACSKAVIVRVAPLSPEGGGSCVPGEEP